MLIWNIPGVLSFYDETKIYIYKSDSEAVKAELHHVYEKDSRPSKFLLLRMIFDVFFWIQQL